MQDLIPIYKTSITFEDQNYFLKILNSNNLTSDKITKKFEYSVADTLNRKHAISTANGSLGMLISLLGLKIGKGDDVILPALCPISCANAVIQTGATPIFCDIDPKFLNINTTNVESLITNNTKAIIFVNNFGNPTNLDQLEKLCQKYEITLIEDFRDAIGSKLNKNPAGSFGRVSVGSFSCNKMITTGEGGIILTNDNVLATNCRKLQNHGIIETNNKIGNSQLCGFGFNAKLPSINAALGFGQLQRLDEIIKKRELLAQYYIEELRNNNNVILPTITNEIQIGWNSFIVRLSDSYSGKDRNKIIDDLRIHDIGSEPYHPSIKFVPFYETYVKDKKYPISETVSKRCIALPMHENLSKKDIHLICQTLDMIIKRLNFGRN